MLRVNLRVLRGKLLGGLHASVFFPSSLKREYVCGINSYIPAWLVQQLLVSGGSFRRTRSCRTFWSSRLFARQLFLVMNMPRGLLLLAVICILPPEAVRAARRLFSVDDPVKLETHRGFSWNVIDFEEPSTEDNDILDLLNQARYHPSVGTYGYGYGYGYYGYYGHHHCLGYGDSSREADADFEELTFLGAVLNRHQGHRQKTRHQGSRSQAQMPPDREYDVYGTYGMQAASANDDVMAQRVRQIDEEDADRYRHHHTHRHQGMPDPVPVRLAEEAVSYSDWEEILSAAFPETGAGPMYGRYRGAAYGYYSVCLGIYYRGGYGGYGSCGGGYGGDHINDLLDDPENLELQEALLEIRELLRNNVREKAVEDMERNKEEGVLSSVLSVDELPGRH
ncbi:hypothetical protein VaNZ11_001049 [Volvox africanus]|uniref:Uncharacterized protein n=1 Tax=Volvox africanus TaxID=51714 RepID=A0ABQ5RNV4_9CHLO|nr:hypothetical protein VaNZ11_001049 [Volvox africanus]